MKIRELIPESSSADLEAIVPAYLAIWNHPENLPFLSFTGQPFKEAQLREWCSQHLSAGVHYFAAINSAGRIQGLLLTRENPIEGFELLSIGVMESEKRQGVGVRLIRHGIDVGLKKGYRSIDGQVYATNSPMLCLLLKEGFVPVRLEHHRGPKGEDLLHLKKYL